MRVVAVVVLCVAPGVVPQCISSNDQVPPPPRPQLEAWAGWSIDLFRDVAVGGGQVVSPLGVWVALSLAYLGALNTTASELQEAVALGDKRATLALYRALMQTYEGSEGSGPYTLHVANRLFVQEYLPLLECVRALTRPAITATNFRQVDAAAETINRYVLGATRGKVAGLIRPRDLSRASLVLANAAYFKGHWHHAFPPANTALRRFYPAPGSPALVDTMELTETLPMGYYGELDAHILELPYTHRRASMFILLPHTVTLDDLLPRLRGHDVIRVVASLPRREVVVRIPKFKLEATLKGELTKALIGMGVQTLFTEDADMRGFFPTGGLWVRSAMHKVVVEVSEEGREVTEAKRREEEARRGTEGAKTPLHPPASFICDKPFMFMVVDNVSRGVLVAGVYRHP